MKTESHFLPPAFFAFNDLIKLQHTLFALPLAVATYVLALKTLAWESWWHPKLIFIFVCIVSARTAAMIFNRLADRHIDPLNPRTANRKVQMEQIGLPQLRILLGFSILVFVVSSFACNLTCGFLSFPTLAVLLGYSYFKRFSSAAHLALGLALGLSPLGVWLALFPSLDWLPLQISFFILVWVAGFDILYALADHEFDVQQGLFSIPSRWGKNKAQFISLALHLMAMLLVLHFYNQNILPLGAASLICLLLGSAQFLFYCWHLKALPYTFYAANVGVSFTFLVGVMLG